MVLEHRLHSFLRPRPPAFGEGLRLGIWQGSGSAGTAAALAENLERLEQVCGLAAGHGVQLLAFPELYLTGYIVKDEIALAQIEADQLASQRAKEQAASAAASVGTTGYNLSTVSDATPGVARPGFTSGGSTATDTPAAVSEPPKPQLPSRYVASVKLDPSRASLQMSAFVEEVMSHLQALAGAQIEMTLEVQVNAPGGIDEQTARIVLENSAALKIDKPGLY